MPDSNPERDEGCRRWRRFEPGAPFGVETGQPVRLVGMFHPAGSEFNAAEAKRSRINAFGIEYEGKTGISASEFAWSA